MSTVPAASTQQLIPSDIAIDTTLPPGPAHSRLVQTYRYATDPLALLDECARKFGDMFTLRLMGSRPWVMLSSPAHAS